MKTVAVTGSFDNLRSKQVRFLQEAAKCGNVHVALWRDEIVQAIDGTPPKFPERERAYLLQSLRFVERVTLVGGTVNPAALPELEGVKPDIWMVDERGNSAAKRAFAATQGIEYRVAGDEDLSGFPVPPFRTPALNSLRKRAVVTGCYDWFHSGHVKFFEEASALGDLYVVVGHDANIKLLKGGGHPMLTQAERRYMVHAVRCVNQVMISTGHGWLDAEPEIAIITPDFYVVNEDGDKPEKREFCSEHDIQYVVLKRIPKEGLPKRESTELRGF